VKFLARRKDGGPESHVVGYWLVEIRSMFSIALLRFGPGGRRAYHSHAFDSISWVLAGHLREQHIWGRHEVHRPGWRLEREVRGIGERKAGHLTSWWSTGRVDELGSAGLRHNRAAPLAKRGSR